METKKYVYLTYITIIGFLIFRIFYIATTHYNLVQDEAYFWDWSRHPALSYYDMGPMVAWIIGFFTSFLPLSEFSVRLGAPVFAAMTAVIIYILAADITESRLLGFVVVVLFHLTPAGMGGGVIITYYTPQIFFMSLTALFLWLLIKRGEALWWPFIGLSLGLGLLSHHMFAFFSAEVGLFILLSKNQRKWLKSPWPYLALLIELAAASPIFIWNIANDYVMFKHATGLMSKVSYFDIASTFLKFIGGQAGIYTPFLFFAVLYGLSVSGYRGIRLRDDKHLMLFCLSAPIIIFIALLSIGGRTEANWPVSGFITGVISGIYIVYEKYKNWTPFRRSFIRASFVFTIFLCVLVSVIAHYPSLIYSIGINIPAQRDPTNRLYGWDELGKNVSAVLETMPQGSFVATINYGLNAELAFYVKGNPQVYEIPVSRRFSQYDFWNDFKNVKGRDAVYVVGNRTIEESVKALFESVELAEHLKIYARTNNAFIRDFYIYKCYGYKGGSEVLSSF